MAFLKGFIAFMFFLLLIVVLWYFTTGFKLPNSTTTISNTSRTTVAATTTVAQGQNNATTSIPYIYDCKTLNLLSGPNSNGPYDCSWSGGPLGLWVASGNSVYENVTVTGADNVIYMTAHINYQCTTFYDNFTVPKAQLLTINIATGNAINDTLANCQYAIVKLNTTLTPPKVYYRQVYNGGFADGKYTGWTLNGSGFGTKPLNITAAQGPNAITPCYIGEPWSNYNGTYFATTYTCGLTNSPGNITSAPFYASEPFLNFQIISPQDNFIYVEILYNNTPYTIARYNTYNNSLFVNSSSESTFRNASIPLFNVIGKPIQIRVVADTLINQDYVAAGDFAMGTKPVEAKGILYNMTFVH